MARGLDREIARRAATAVLVGAGGLLRHRNEDPEQMVDAFVEYRGITAAGIEGMRQAGFEAIVSKGLAAAFNETLTTGNHS